MAAHPARRTPTLSISLTTELLAAVNERVASGMYSSASELLREALRLFLGVEKGGARGRLTSSVGGASAVAERSMANFASTTNLFAQGAELQEQRLRRELPGLDPDELQRRILDAQTALETDQVIRPSPERLQKLRDRHGSS